jgi:hypothetical protein
MRTAVMEMRLDILRPLKEAEDVNRAMDTAVALGVDIGSAVQRKAEYNKTRPYRNGGKIA